MDWNTHKRQEAGKETVEDFKKKGIGSRCYKEGKGLMEQGMLNGMGDGVQGRKRSRWSTD